MFVTVTVTSYSFYQRPVCPILKVLPVFLVVRGIRLGCCSLPNPLPLQGMVMMDRQQHATCLREMMSNMLWLFTKNILALHEKYPGSSRCQKVELTLSCDQLLDLMQAHVTVTVYSGSKHQEGMDRQGHSHGHGHGLFILATSHEGK